MIDKRKEKARANGHHAEPLGEVTPPRNLNRRDTDRKTNSGGSGRLITLSAVVVFLCFILALLAYLIR